ncbi:MAG: hypothetical protein ACRCYV_06920 [Aeromonas sp.]
MTHFPMPINRPLPAPRHNIILAEQKDQNPYFGAVVIGQGVIMPHPTLANRYCLPGGLVCNRQQAERAAVKLHHLITVGSLR